MIQAAKIIGTGLATTATIAAGVVIGGLFGALILLIAVAGIFLISMLIGKTAFSNRVRVWFGAIFSHFIVIIRKSFRLSNLLTILFCAIIGWSIRTLLVHNYNLDLDSLLGFTSAVVPAGLITAMAREIVSLLIEGNSLKLGTGDISSGALFSSSNPGYNLGTGSSSNTGYSSASCSSSGVTVNESDADFRARARRQLEEQRAVYTARKEAKDMFRRQGQTFAMSHSPEEPRLIQ